MALASTFRSGREVADCALATSGRLPRWLAGALLRNGPGGFAGPGWEARHLFDGLAFLQRFGFADGAVRYRARYLRSPLQRAAMEGARARWRGFGVPSPRTPIDILRMILAPDYADNAGVSLVPVDGHLLALTETPYPVAIDPDTLATRGRFTFGDEQEELFAQTTTAHPVRDGETGELVNLVTKFAGRERWYRCWRLRPGSARREVFATLPVDQPAYLHGFGLSRRHLVLVEFPLLLDPLRLLLGEDSYIGAFRWRPERGTRVRVVERVGGRVAVDATIPACFAFHHLNAHEHGDELVAELLAYPDPAIIDAFYADAVARGARRPSSRLLRLRIDLRRGRVVSESPSSRAMEFGSVAPSRVGLRARWAYGVGSSDESEGGAYDSLLKLDLDSHGAATWSEPDHRCGEPLFVADPDGEAEDDGVVLAPVHAPDGGRDFLVALDAASWDELGRAWLPTQAPYSFHGCFLPRS